MIKNSRKKIKDGIHFTTILNECQKTNTIIVHFVTKLSSETAALNAIVPYVLSNSSDKYRTLTELSKKLSSLYGGTLKGSASKIGDSQVITLMAGCINDRYTFDGEKITEELAKILVECITEAFLEDGRFSESDFLLKKQELLDDIDSEINDKSVFAFKRASMTVYKDEPCAVSAKGERIEAEKITALSAYEQYKKLISEAQIEITFVGSEVCENAEKYLADAFSSIERNYAGDNYSDFSPIKNEPVNVTEHYDVTQSKMVIAFKSDYKNSSAMKVMNAIFGGTPFSKLFVNVRERLSLCYTCSSRYNDKKGVLMVNSGVENVNIQKAQDEIMNQLKAMQNGDFTDDDIKEAALDMINSIKGVNDGARSIAEWYFQQSYSGKKLSPEDEIENIKAVTREDIIEAANSLTLDTVYVLTGKEESSNDK